MPWILPPGQHCCRIIICARVQTSRLDANLLKKGKPLLLMLKAKKDLYYEERVLCCEIIKISFKGPNAI